MGEEYIKLFVFNVFLSFDVRLSYFENVIELILGVLFGRNYWYKNFFVILMSVNIFDLDNFVSKSDNFFVWD